MAQTKVFEILDEAKELGGKIEKYKGVADQDMMIVWMDNTLKLLTRMGKAVEELEDRMDLLEEEAEKKKF